MENIKREEQEWEEKLKRHNLSNERGDPEMVPLDIVGPSSPFLKLSSEMQTGIIDYLKKQREEGISVGEAKAKLMELVEKSIELEQMDGDDSDKNYKKPEKTEVEQKIEEIIVENVDDLIKKLEDMKYKEDDKKNNWVN